MGVLRAVTFGGDTFVAVEDSGIVWNSRDGLNWSPQNSHTLADLTGVAYGNGKFIAVGAETLTSIDGVTWIRQPVGLSGLQGVAFGNGQFVAVRDSFSFFSEG